jgi:hypothetical protein
MHKLPVFATAGRAYAFLVRKFGTILRLSWFVIVLVLIVQYLAARALYAAMRPAIEARDVVAFANLASMSPWQIINALAMMLGTAIVAVALHRVILFGDHRPGSYLHFALGKVELLFVLLSIIFYVAITGTFFLGILAAVLSGAPIFMGLLAVSAVVALLLLAVRLTPIFPVTVLVPDLGPHARELLAYPRPVDRRARARLDRHGGGATPDGRDVGANA